MDKNIPFQDVADLLVKEAVFPARHLHRFSDLEAADIQILMKSWPHISLTRKLALLEDLEELAERDTLVSFETLAQALLTDPDAGIRTSAIRLLWESEDKKLIQIFLDILNQDESSTTRAAAASALGSFVYLGELEKIPASTLHEIEEHLLTAVNHGKTPSIRQRALEALGTSSRQEIPILIESAYHQKEAQWKVSSLFAMGRSGDNRWEKYILANLHDHDLDIRSEAIRAAGRQNLTSARSPLLDMLEDEEDLEIRREIIWALSEIGGNEVRTKINELLDMETDEDEVDFLEEALENLLFTDDNDHLSLLDFEQDNLENDDEDNNDDKGSSE